MIQLRKQWPDGVPMTIPAFLQSGRVMAVPIDGPFPMIPPASAVNPIKDDTGQTAHDDTGTPLQSSILESLLSAIYALAKEFRNMTGSLSTTLAELAAASTARSASIEAAVAALTAKIEALQAAATPDVGEALSAIQTAADKDAASLKAIEGLIAPPAAQ